MPYLAQVIKEESDRLKANKALYEKELQSLPRKGGHIRVRVVKGHEYYYYNFREGEKVKSKYIKKEDVPQFLQKKEINFYGLLKILIKICYLQSIV